MAEPTAPAPAELDDVVRFIAAQQARVDRRITYVGTDAAGIAAELAGIAPPWSTTVRVLRGPGDPAAVTGAVVVEWDEGLGRAWIIGPWVDAADADAAGWEAAAADLLDAALAQVPAGVTRHEMSAETAHLRLAALAAARGWGATEPNHLLVADAAVVAAWPAGDGTAGDGATGADGAELRPATAADVAAVAALHDVEFPDTYASAAQVVAGGLDGTRVVLVADGPGGALAGYAAGEVHEDGEGYIDFLAVDPAARGRGLGRRLTVALTRQLLDRSPQPRVALTVQDSREPARALYRRLGFRAAGVLVAYRSWLAAEAAAPREE
jgi:ribosomal protein S18 acetylase RimI-like enzyme